MARIEIEGRDGPEEVHLLREKEPAYQPRLENTVTLLHYDAAAWWKKNAAWILASVALLLVFFWIAPRIYEPTYFAVDPLNSREIYYYKRHWFSATEQTKLRAKFDTDLKTWRWHAMDRDGKWYPFFVELIEEMPD